MLFAGGAGGGAGKLAREKLVIRNFNDTPLSPKRETYSQFRIPLSRLTATAPLTGEPHSQSLRNGSTSNKLSLFIASDVSTTNSFYGACACKNWVLASGRDACEAGREGIARVVSEAG